MNAEVDAAVNQRLLGATPFDDEDRDVGTPTSQFVGDASEHVDALLMGRGDERQVTRSARLGANPAEIDNVRQNLALEAKGPAVVIGGESGRDDNSIRGRERSGVGVTKSYGVRKTAATPRTRPVI